MTFAMSGLRSNPMTGEMIDGDVIFDASWIKTWKEEYAFLVGIPIPTGTGAMTDQPQGLVPLAMGEIISPIMAMKQGYGLPVPPPGTRRAAALNAAILGHGGLPGSVAPRNGSIPMALDVVPAGWDPIQVQLRQRFAQGRMSTCNYAAAKSHEMRFASLALAMASTADTDADADKKDADKKKDAGKDKKDADKDKKDADKKEKEKELKLPDEFLGQAIKEVVMHEVGHSLGLRHNFKASIMLKPDQVNDTSITRVKGMTGSVMDYNPINVAPKGQKQGDYASTTIGPYDYWAIAYAYTPYGNEAELKKIAARSPEPDLAFATDDDFMSNDPQVNTYDLTSDTLAYGKMRMAMASELLKDLDKKVVKDGESWARLRSAFSACISQFGNGAYLAAEYIGGQSVNRDFKGTDKSSRPRHAHRGLAPARGPQADGRPDPQRQGVPVLARPAPQALHRVLAGQPVLLLWRHGLSDLPDDSQHPGDRAGPVPRFQRAPADPESGDAERGRQQPAQDRRRLPLAERRHLHRAGARRPRAPPLSRSPRFAAISSVSISSGSAPWSWVPRTTSRLTATSTSSTTAANRRPRRTPRTWRGCISMRSAGRSTALSVGRRSRSTTPRLAHLKEIQFRIDKVLKANLSVNEP